MKASTRRTTDWIKALALIKDVMDVMERNKLEKMFRTLRTVVFQDILKAAVKNMHSTETGSNLPKIQTAGGNFHAQLPG
jgi:hypothetical protein